MKALLAAALLALTTQAWAADPDSDSLTIRITPNVDLGVDVDTGTARFNYADTPGDLDIPLDPGATAYLISPATVTITGNFSNQEIEMVGSTLTTWTLDFDEGANEDAVQLYGLFAVNKSSAPTEQEFAGANNLIKSSPFMAGQPVADEAGESNHQYEKSAATGMDGAAQMDNLPVGTQRQLWLRLDAPPTTSDDSTQQIHVTLTARSGATN